VAFDGDVAGETILFELRRGIGIGCPGLSATGSTMAWRPLAPFHGGRVSMKSPVSVTVAAFGLSSLGVSFCLCSCWIRPLEGLSGITELPGCTCPGCPEGLVVGSPEYLSQRVGSDSLVFLILLEAAWEPGVIFRDTGMPLRTRELGVWVGLGG